MKPGAVTGGFPPDWFPSRFPAETGGRRVRMRTNESAPPERTSPSWGAVTGRLQVAGVCATSWRVPPCAITGTHCRNLGLAACDAGLPCVTCFTGRRARQRQRANRSGSAGRVGSSRTGCARPPTRFVRKNYARKFCPRYSYGGSGFRSRRGLIHRAPLPRAPSSGWSSTPAARRAATMRSQTSAETWPCRRLGETLNGPPISIR